MASWRHMCVLLFLWLPASECTSHVSLESLSELASKEQSIFREIGAYQQTRQTELDRLTRKIAHIEQEHREASAGAEAYFGNPLNAFRVIKRLVIEWNWIHDFVTNANTTQDFIDKWTSDMDRLELSTELDLHHAIGDLINTSDAVDGAGGDIIYGEHMKWDECYEVAVHLFDTEQFLEALFWFEVTLKKLESAEAEYSDFQPDVVEYIAFSKYLLGDVPGTYSMLGKLNDSSPTSAAGSKEVKEYFLLVANSFSFARVNNLKNHFGA